ncbi:MAG: DUF1731 domain-containing protein [Candidatus Aminicenantes bacterium]
MAVKNDPKGGRVLVTGGTGFIGRALIGAKAEETNPVSQRALPVRLPEAGFSFNFPEIQSALHDIHVD